MVPVIVIAVIVWLCIRKATPLHKEQVETITNYIEKNIFPGLQTQYAYFVKFTAEEYNKPLQPQDFNEVLKVDKSAGILDKVLNNEIYIGERMVAASYKKEKKYEIHAESRLLNPLPDTKKSPISTLLEKAPAAGCVVFFSLNSPCVQTCTDPDGKYNIIDKLNKVPLPNSRAFAFAKVFGKDKEKDVWKNWELLNAKMPLLRCNDNNCIQCFNNGVKDDKCFIG